MNSMKLITPLDRIGTAPGIYVTQSFGENLRDYKQFGLIGHNGTDYAAPRGTPVKAAHDGLLLTKPQDVGYGIHARVVWEEDGFTYDTIYAHLKATEGLDRRVRAGQIIGYVNSTGFSTGDHLHFGIRKLKDGSVVEYDNGYLGYFDPAPYFEKPNQAKIVKSKKSETIYICYPMPTWQYLEERASMESIKLDVIESDKI